MEKMEIQDEKELQTVAQNILEVLKGKKGDKAQVLALHGDLGAGKTAFVKALASVLGVEEEVTSPTFVILKLYSLEQCEEYETLAHIDAYRIESIDEMRPLYFQELLSQKDTLVCIEWAERIQDLLPKDTLHLHFSIKGGGREITFT